jgi:hypothetical protein
MFSDEYMGRRRATNAHLQINFPFTRTTMNSENNRVLGRVLAVEEIHAVSGARPTSPSADNGTFPPTDTGYVYDIIPADVLDAGMISSRAKTL